MSQSPGNVPAAIENSWLRQKAGQRAARAARPGRRQQSSLAPSPVRRLSDRSSTVRLSKPPAVQASGSVPAVRSKPSLRQRHRLDRWRVARPLRELTCQVVAAEVQGGQHGKALAVAPVLRQRACTRAPRRMGNLCRLGAARVVPLPGSAVQQQRVSGKGARGNPPQRSSSSEELPPLKSFVLRFKKSRAGKASGSPQDAGSGPAQQEPQSGRGLRQLGRLMDAHA